MTTLLDQLRQRRDTARQAAEQILTRAADEQRDLTPDELADHRQQVTAEREAADEADRVRDEQIAELRATAARRTGPPAPRGPVLTREQSIEDWARTRGLIPDDQQLSFDRYLRGMATGNWDGAEHERALSEGTLTAGGHLVPTPLSARVIDLARNQTRVFQAGAITVPMTAQTLKLARLTGEGSPAWKTENAAITDADMTFDSRDVHRPHPGPAGQAVRRAVRGRRPVQRGRDRPLVRLPARPGAGPGRAPRHRHPARTARRAQHLRRDGHHARRQRREHHQLRLADRRRRRKREDRSLPSANCSPRTSRTPPPAPPSRPTPRNGSRRSGPASGCSPTCSAPCRAMRTRPDPANLHPDPIMLCSPAAGGAVPRLARSRTPIPIPESLALTLSAHVAAFSADGWLLTDEAGHQLGPWQLQRAFRAARAKVDGLPAGFRFHDLRHYYASLLIASGRDVKVVQTRLRHASAKTTLDTYGHLWPDSDDSTRAAVDKVLAARAANPGDFLRTRGGGEARNS